MRIKERLSRKDIALFKLALWAGLVAWMLSFAIFVVLGSMVMRNKAEEVWGEGWLGDVMYWVAPIWFVFTGLIIIVVMAKWVDKKLRVR